MIFRNVVAGFMVTTALFCRATRADDAGKALADTMVKAYQGTKTYQGTWHILQADTNDQRMLLDVAFDRKTRQVLVRLQPQVLKGQEWVTQPGGQLFVHDGKKMHKAIHDGEKWVTSSVDSPKDFSYRDVRRSLTLFSLVDLPVLLSEHPVEEWLQGEVGEVKTLAAEPKDENKRPGLKVSDKLMESEITVRLDPNTHFVKEAAYGPMRFELFSVSVDKPLAAGTFDFTSTLKTMQAVK